MSKAKHTKAINHRSVEYLGRKHYQAVNVTAGKTEKKRKCLIEIERGFGKIAEIHVQAVRKSLEAQGTLTKEEIDAECSKIYESAKKDISSTKRRARRTGKVIHNITVKTTFVTEKSDQEE